MLNNKATNGGGDVYLTSNKASLEWTGGTSTDTSGWVETRGAENCGVASIISDVDGNPITASKRSSCRIPLRMSPSVLPRNSTPCGMTMQAGNTMRTGGKYCHRTEKYSLPVYCIIHM